MIIYLCHRNADSGNVKKYIAASLTSLTLSLLGTLLFKYLALKTGSFSLATADTMVEKSFHPVPCSSDYKTDPFSGFTVLAIKSLF